MHVQLDDVADAEFWEHCHDEELDGTPLYYRPFLDRKPDRVAAAVAAVADAGPGGVVVSCGAGRDRTGLVSLLLLALVGVDHEDIVSDYVLGDTRLPARWVSRGEIDQRPVIERILTRKHTSIAICSSRSWDRWTPQPICAKEASQTHSWTIFGSG